MNRNTVLCAVTLGIGLLTAHPALAQSSKTNSSGEVTVEGCVGMSGSHYVLMQTDPGHAFTLRSGSREVQFKSLLGKQVEVTGHESSTSGTLHKPGTASPLTLTVTSVKTISKSCVHTTPSEDMRKTNEDER